ncbi:uncharacterized protein LOC120143317 [Hibiscus syriacus]|uniref:uncharacterized protein LOC120143317 n=1 Tax=Hibiscus syriacus TaxID=106335 RepID=UPI001924E9A0|nr:uncharacterized protein LOC120143317 [Hibiscus syriacus]
MNRKVAWRRMKYSPSFAFPKPLHLTALAKLKQKRRLRKLNGCIRKLKADMVGIRVEQKEIREGQRRVREKFEALESECDQLRKETNQLMQQSVNTQIRLALMFQILRARENQEYDQEAKLTYALRESIARENQQRNFLHDEG